MKKIILLPIMMAVSVLLTACVGFKAEKEYSETFMAMDTVISITCYGKESKEAVEAVRSEITRLDNLFSVGNNESDISRINSTFSAEVSTETVELINISNEIYDRTGGTFCISVRPLMKLWGFEDGKLNIPDENEISAVLKTIAQDDIVINNGIVTIPEGSGIDFGGIAKGYAGEKITKILEQYDVRYAVASLGGNIQCYGKKKDGSPFKIAIKNPNPDRGEIIGAVNVDAKSVVTSGAYERFFTDEDGRIYCHIINPKTGHPVESDITSITIISENGTYADALSTACFVMGKDNTIKFWKEHKNEFDFVMITEKDEIYVSSGIAKQFNSENKTITVE